MSALGAVCRLLVEAFERSSAVLGDFSSLRFSAITDALFAFYYGMVFDDFFFSFRAVFVVVFWIWIWIWKWIWK